MAERWTVPRMWEGETCVCIAGGPSLTREQVDYVRGRARVIDINDAYKLAPWADVLYACDLKWWEWHDGVPDFRGLKVSQDQAAADQYGLLWIEPTANPETHKPDGFDPDPSHIRTGKNGGYQAIHLATHLGAKRIILIGYDMHAVNGKTHWHDGHPGGTRGTVYEIMLRHWPTIVEPLKERGIEVINCTPGSVLDVFPKAALEKTLC